MKPNLSKEENQIINGLASMPSVSIIMPLETDISLEKELKHKLKTTLDKVKKELLTNYPEDRTVAVVNKLEHLFQNIDYHTKKKSIGIFVSPLVEKIFYLKNPVHEKIVIDKSFEIRDLIYNNENTIPHLILLLSGATAKVYLSDAMELTPIKFEVPTHVESYENDSPERVSNFSDPGKHKEDLLNKFLNHIDMALSTIIKAHPFPVFVIGPEKILGYFNKLSKNSESIIKNIHGNYMEATKPEILELIGSNYSSLQKPRETEILKELEQAADNHKIASGIKDVWYAAAEKTGKLLVIEKDIIFPAEEESFSNEIQKEDLIDLIIENVLESGGNIEFVDNDILKDYSHIALILYQRPYVE